MGQSYHILNNCPFLNTFFNMAANYVIYSKVTIYAGVYHLLDSLKV